MLSIYDLYDLHAILIRIRFSPENTMNSEIILKVKDVLMNRCENSDSNQFRVALQSINDLKNEEAYDFIYIRNKYIYYPLPLLKDERIYAVLIRCCEELLHVISTKNCEQIFELADCLHNLPLFLVENKLTIPRNYWKNEIRYYRRKWNTNFLVVEQQKLRIKRKI